MNNRRQLASKSFSYNNKNQANNNVKNSKLGFLNKDALRIDFIQAKKKEIFDEAIDPVTNRNNPVKFNPHMQKLINDSPLNTSNGFMSRKFDEFKNDIPFNPFLKKKEKLDKSNIRIYEQIFKEIEEQEMKNNYFPENENEIIDDGLNLFAFSETERVLNYNNANTINNIDYNNDLIEKNIYNRRQINDDNPYNFESIDYSRPYDLNELRRKEEEELALHGNSKGELVDFALTSLNSGNTNRAVNVNKKKEKPIQNDFTIRVPPPMKKDELYLDSVENRFEPMTVSTEMNYEISETWRQKSFDFNNLDENQINGLDFYHNSQLGFNEDKQEIEYIMNNNKRNSYFHKPMMDKKNLTIDPNLYRFKEDDYISPSSKKFTDDQSTNQNLFLATYSHEKFQNFQQNNDYDIQLLNKYKAKTPANISNFNNKLSNTNEGNLYKNLLNKVYNEKNSTMPRQMEKIPDERKTSNKKNGPDSTKNNKFKDRSINRKEIVFPTMKDYVGKILSDVNEKENILVSKMKKTSNQTQQKVSKFVFY